MDNSNQKDTRLLDAIATCNLSKIIALIAEGFDANQFDMANDNFTPLMLAISLERADIVKILLKAGANLYDSPYFEDIPLGLTVRKGNFEIVELLLQSGANPNRSGDSPPLSDAVGGKHIDIIKLLINWNADINLTDSGRISPLMIAAAGGNLEIVKLLVEAGADVNATDDIEYAGEVAVRFVLG
jgi:uncharacterized protein